VTAPNDPLYNAYYNEGLGYVEHLLETGGIEAGDFAKLLLSHIREAKKPTDFQEAFSDAIRNDPYMSQENKEFWLKHAGDDRPPAMRCIMCGDEYRPVCNSCYANEVTAGEVYERE